MKKGITLVALILTVIVAIMLIGVSVANYNTSKERANKTMILNDLKSIETSVRSYYVLNSAIPTNEESKNYTELVNMINDKGFEKDLNLNNDTSATFYLIDFSKLNVDSMRYKSEFYVSIPNLNVYYKEGFNFGVRKYYSLTSELINKENID